MAPTVTNPDFDPDAQNSVTPDQADRHQLRLAHLNDEDVPREVVTGLLRKVEEQSLLTRLGTKIRVGYGDTTIRVDGTNPEAGQVGVGTAVGQREGYEKPRSGFSWNRQSFGPIKLAVIVTASSEFERVDPDGFASEVEGKLVDAISRATDLAAFQNRDAITGSALLGTTLNGYINETTNRINLDGVTGLDLNDAFIDGYEMVNNSSEDFDFNGWAADKRLRGSLMRARNDQGEPVFQAGNSTNLRDQFGNLLGLPLAFGKAVSGLIGASADTGVRLVGGDFGRLFYGFADSIEIKRTNVGSIGAVNLWTTNQVAWMAEVTMGWLVQDPDAFVVYTSDGNPSTS
jgi:HK97 family phage major capsid protein